MPAIVANFLNSTSDSDQYVYLAIPLAFLFYMQLNLKILRTVLQAREINWDILCGVISVYLLLGMNWTLIYTFLDLLNPHSFSIHTVYRDDGVMGNTDFFYFSFVTLTTLGYGDIVPITVPARVFAVLEAIVGQLYIAVIIGKIISVSPLRSVLPAPSLRERHAAVPVASAATAATVAAKPADGGEGQKA